MKTYAESKTHIPFDWHAFLKKEHTESELKEARRLSSDWVTCACGNQCDVIPRGHSGCPLDDELFQLGTRFATNITGMWIFCEQNEEQYKVERLKAIATLHGIDERSSQIIERLTNQ